MSDECFAPTNPSYEHTPPPPPTQIRNMELACYFTHGQLQTPHLILTLRTALNMLYKMKNYRSAAAMARRLLDLAPSMEVAQQTRRLLQASEAATPHEDAHALAYDPRNPFEICAATYTPIYRLVNYFGCCSLSLCSFTLGS